MKTRYRIVHEPYVEISFMAMRKSGFYLIDAHMVEGVLNGTFETVAVFFDIEEARRELSKYRCSSHVASGSSGTKFIAAEFYFIVEDTYNEELEDWDNETDICDFAEVDE